MIGVCFWYQMKGLALSYNLMLFLKKWLKIRYSRAKTKKSEMDLIRTQFVMTTPRRKEKIIIEPCARYYEGCFQ